jgi:hypothetical protein
VREKPVVIVSIEEKGPPKSDLMPSTKARTVFTQDALPGDDPSFLAAAHFLGQRSEHRKTKDMFKRCVKAQKSTMCDRR